MSNENMEMSKALREAGKIGEDESVRVVSLDDTFKFNCVRCGKCCSCRSDIILTPFDIYQIAKALNITTKEVVMEYCNIMYGNNSGLPLITLKSDERDLCPFLKFSVEEGKFGCSINTHKPGVCIMHPIGAVRKFNTETHETENKEYMLVPACDNNTADVEYKVRDFIKPYLDNETEHDIGSALQFEIGKYIDTRKLLNVVFEPNKEYIENNLTQEERDNLKEISRISRLMFIEVFLSSTIKTGYMFDMSKSFIEQIDEVKRGIRLNALNALSTVNLLTGIDFKSNCFPKDAEEELKSVEEMLDNHVKSPNEEEVKNFVNDFINTIKEKMEDKVND